MAVATAAYMTLVEVGGAVGAAVSGAVWGHLVPQKLATYLPAGSYAARHAADIYASVVVACSYPWGGPEREAIAQAYQESMTVLLCIALAGCVPLALLALLGVEDYQLDGEDGRGGINLGRGVVVARRGSSLSAARPRHGSSVDHVGEDGSSCRGDESRGRSRRWSLGPEWEGGMDSERGLLRSRRQSLTRRVMV